VVQIGGRPSSHVTSQRVRPEKTPLYKIIKIIVRHLETWLCERSLGEEPVAAHVEDFSSWLPPLRHSQLRVCSGLGAAPAGVIFSWPVAGRLQKACKGRGVCPSCTGRRMAQTAAHLVDHVIPPVPV